MTLLLPNRSVYDLSLPGLVSTWTELRKKRTEALSTTDEEGKKAASGDSATGGNSDGDGSSSSGGTGALIALVVIGGIILAYVVCSLWAIIRGAMLLDRNSDTWTLFMYLLVWLFACCVPFVGPPVALYLVYSKMM